MIWEEGLFPAELRQQQQQQLGQALVSNMCQALRSLDVKHKVSEK